MTGARNDARTENLTYIELTFDRVIEQLVLVDLVSERPGKVKFSIIVLSSEIDICSILLTFLQWSSHPITNLSQFCSPSNSLDVTSLFLYCVQYNIFSVLSNRA